MRRSIKGIFISAIASALLLTGCSTGQSSTESKKKKKYHLKMSRKDLLMAMEPKSK